MASNEIPLSQLLGRNPGPRLNTLNIYTVTLGAMGEDHIGSGLAVPQLFADGKLSNCLDVALNFPSQH